MERNKNSHRANKKDNKSIRRNSAGGCIHITSGLVSSKTFRASREKTPLTPDKECKWIPTCGEVELKRPFLIMTNMRWWLHCVYMHTRTHTHKKKRINESWCINWTTVTNERNWKAHSLPQNVKGEQKTLHNAKISFLKEEETPQSQIQLFNNLLLIFF